MTSIVIWWLRRAPEGHTSRPSQVSRSSWLKKERRCYLVLKEARLKRSSTKMDVKLLAALQISALSV